MNETNLFIFGLCGKMGQEIIANAAAFNCRVTGGFDQVIHPSIPTFSTVNSINVPFDVIVDFSRPEVLESVLCLAKKSCRPMVLATTGYSKEQQDAIDQTSKDLPVFQTANMSIGINVMNKLLGEFTKLLSDYDIEIIEKHHNQKVDAPSGTAKMLANSINQALDEKAQFIYGREGNDAKRKQGEICIHSVRGGTIVGEHEVLFCGGDEVITIGHSASSRKVLATGAINAAKFILDSKPGKYNMSSLLDQRK